MEADDRPTRRVALIGSFAGWAGDAFDYQIYSLALPLLLAHWTLSPAMAGTIASASLAAAAVGGTAGGRLSDRFGRFQVLQAAILLAALATAACAVVATPPQMLAARAVQGLAFGAEWSVGAVLLSEHAPDERRGRYLGLMQSAWAVGWAGAVVAFLVATVTLPPASAWRAMFLAGLLPILLVLWLRRHAPPVPRKAPREAMAVRGAQVPYTRWALTGLIGLGAHGGYHSLFTWIPALLRREAGHSDLRTGIVLLLMTAGFAVGCIVAGRLADRIGRRWTLALFATLSLAASAVVGLDDAVLGRAPLLAVPIGFAVGGTPAVLGAWFSELFPAPVRGGGVGFAYNAGRIASAIIPGAIGWASGRAPLGVLVGIAAGLSYALILLVLPLLPETRGHRLGAVA